MKLVCLRGLLEARNCPWSAVIVNPLSPVPSPASRRKFGQLLDLVPMADDVVKLQGICM